jgi:LemA protein
MALYIVGGIILILIFVLIGIFNSFARNRNVVKDAWSNIDVQLKRRHDLIPNIVNTVKGYAAHESGTLEKVIQARNAAVNVSADDINAKIAAENQLQQSLRSIFALSESYPDLKANANFLSLQGTLAEIEESLERSRRYYNATVRDNNTYGESFPGAMFAGMFKFQHFDYFEADATSRENVVVDFSK